MDNRKINNNKKISIIIPIYNAELYIRRCLESLINQTYKNIEVVCVNDGSIDNSLKILEEYTNKDGRIVIINQKNKGVSSARNIGIKKSSGDIITFIDVDDWIEYDYIELVMKFYNENNCDMLKTNYMISDGNNKNFVYSYSEHSKKISNDEMLKILSCDQFFNCVWGTFYDAKTLKNDEIVFDENIIFAEDLLFQSICYRNFKNIYWLNCPKYNYFVNLNGACRSNNTKHLIKKCQDAYYVYSYIYSLGNYKKTIYKIMYPIIFESINYIMKNSKTTYKEFRKYISLICGDDKKYKIKLFELRKFNLAIKQRIGIYLLANEKYLIYYMFFKINKIWRKK